MIRGKFLMAPSKVLIIFSGAGLDKTFLIDKWGGGIIFLCYASIPEQIYF